MEDEFDINGEKIVPHRPKRSIFNRVHQDGKRLKEPVDPYAVIIDHQLDLLRPSLKDIIQIEDPYSYSGTASRLDMASLHRAFFRSGVLQIMSARSRPDAFLSPSTMENPEGADPGVVEIKVTKVGILWRKEMKKKKTRSPWHEWGAILTGSQLYFFRNLHWVKNLMQQYDQHHKYNPGTPVVFKPPLEQFKPDAQISTDDAVALLDKGYKKHKNAFAFVRHGGIQEYFIAESEVEMNDWLAKLNYAATFRSAGVRMRGVVGGNYEGQRTRGIRRMDSISGSPGSNSVQTPSGEVNIMRGGIDTQLAAEISAARREVIEHKISDSEDKLADCNRQLQIHLRNAKHLTILTPIQPKAREQVVVAAGLLAARLQWIRMEMWKLRCHRDILALDSDEERKSTRDQTRRNLAIITPQVSCNNSPTASVRGSPPSTPGSGVPTPTQAMFTPEASAGDLSSHATLPPSICKGGSLYDVPSGVNHSAKGSISSTIPRSPSVSSVLPYGASSSVHGNDDQSFETSRQSPTPTMSESSFGAEVGKENEEEKEEARGKGKEKGKGKDKDYSRPSVRKTIQRTLRESQALGHRRGKSSRDVSGENGAQSGLGHAGESEGLARGAGSFTVHGMLGVSLLYGLSRSRYLPCQRSGIAGKKASVITFGSEWQSMSAEDRLRRNKANQAGAESDSLLDPESGPSTVFASRRGSQQPSGRKDDDDSAIPHSSRRGSHVTLLSAPARKEDELPGVPEHVDVFSPGAEENLIAKLNGVVGDGRATATATAVEATASIG